MLIASAARWAEGDTLEVVDLDEDGGRWGGRTGGEEQSNCFVCKKSASDAQSKFLLKTSRGRLFRVSIFAALDISRLQPLRIPFVPQWKWRGKKTDCLIT